MPSPSSLGFTSVKAFQQAYNLGPWLKVDGIQGPKTNAALQNCINHGNLISPHFRASEFSCRCGGSLPGCKKTLVLRDLLSSLEALRGHTGSLSIVSGYRCPEHNKAVGGAPDSQHLYGSAADIPGKVGTPAVKSLHVFAGIGYQHSTNLVVHVDRRDVSGHNSTHGSTVSPSTWMYS